MDSFNESVALADVLHHLWDELRTGAARGGHPFHTPALATTTADGASLRTVVLRAADRKLRRLLCHTDFRSPKYAEVQANARVAWLFYDRERKLQLRLWGTGRLHHRDALAKARWVASPDRSRACYRADLAPGWPVDGMSRSPWLDEEGLANFAVIDCRVDTIDWLYLRSDGHLRAKFLWSDGTWQGTWIAP
jgi:hypothetical protein